jgi:high-affinity iron transporter
MLCEDVQRRRWWQAWGVWLFAAAIIAALVAGVLYGSSGPADPTDAPGGHERTVVVVNSAIIVFREGLEAILIFAAVTAAMLGANRALRRPVAAGAGIAFLACIATWFGAQAILAQFSRYGDQLQAVTGLLAVAVLLIVLNWFFHKVYWTKWIGKRTEQRKRALARGPGASILSGQLIGLLLLGFTSVYREGFEVVLFLQTLQLQAGTPAVLEGVIIGLAGTCAVGFAMFHLQQKLPYKRMLVVTGVLLGFVLVVMVGGSARTLQDLGWLPTTPIGPQFPEWTARWFEVVPTWETIGAQVFAAGLVLASYFAAEYVRVRRPRRRGEAAALRPAAPPLEPVTAD